MGTKVCNRCNRELPIQMFGKGKNYKDGYRNGCKECVKKYYEDNKIVIAEKRKIYYEANRETIKEYKKVNKEATAKYNRKYYKNNKLVITIKSKKYYEINKEVLKEKKNQKNINKYI